jgi:hypothetical protein
MMIKYLQATFTSLIALAQHEVNHDLILWSIDIAVITPNELDFIQH